MKRRLLTILCLVLLLTAASADTLSYNVRHGDRSVPRVAITMDDCSDISIVEQTFRFCV